MNDTPTKRERRRRKKEAQRKAKRAGQDALAALEQAVRLFAGVAGETGVPGLQSGVASLVSVIDMIKQSKANVEDIARLDSRIRELAAIVEQSTALRGAELPAYVQRRVDRLQSEISDVGIEAREIRARNLCMRVVKSKPDADTVKGLVSRVADAIQLFTAGGVAVIEVKVENIERVATAIETTLETHVQVSTTTGMETRRALEQIQKGIENLSNSREDFLGGLPVATRARYDSLNDIASCLPGTRKAVLEQIQAWIRPTAPNMDSDVPQALPDKDQNIFWLNGLAGTGKTTIAYTMCKWCAERVILGASFFCSRSDADCSDASKIILTIVYQLGYYHLPLGRLLSEILRNDPLVVNAAIPTQLEKLIVKPLQELAVTSPVPACVVLVDAADECDKKTTTSSLISTLLFHADALRPIRFIITSRPENHISVSFNRAKFRNAAGRLVLHQVELTQVTQDIKLYLWTLLSEDVAERFAVPANWPDAEDVEALALLAKGLFIFAATLVRFISDAKYSNPRGQLRRILSAPPSSYAFLDQLYLQVLTSAIADVSNELAKTMRLLLSSIVLAKEPLSPNALAALLGLDPFDIINALAGLHAVLIIPSRDELDKSIRTIHPTFAEFLTDSERCTNIFFLVNSPEHHATLLYRCLRTMSDHLKRDICDIGDPSLLRNEIVDLSDRIVLHIPSHLAYSCRYWAAHAEQCKHSDDLLRALGEFAQKYLLNWVEACSLLNILRESIVALSSAERHLTRIAENSQTTVELLTDCFRLITAGFEAISASPLHVYQSAAQLVPCKTALAKTLVEGTQHSVRTVCGIPASWSPLLRTFVGHNKTAASMAQFSPDGATFVSAGMRDNTVQLWDSVSCVLLMTLKGHDSTVLSAQFSPNGAHVVSASADGTVRVWDVSSGLLLSLLKGHRDSVVTAVFSPDGERIVSGSRDFSLNVWDVKTGTCIVTLERHRNSVTHVSFSPDGSILASGSDRVTTEPIYLWDPKDNVIVGTVGSRGARAFVFTPDSAQLIVQELAGNPGFDVWDVRTQTRLRRLCEVNFPSALVACKCLAISPDGARLAYSGTPYADSPIILVDTIRGDVLRELPGHTNRIESISFSSDGARLLSCSYDGSIRLWDVTPRSASSAHSTDGNSTRLRFVQAVFSDGDDRSLLTLNEAGDVNMYHPVTWNHTSLRRGDPAVRGGIYASRDKDSVLLYQELDDAVRFEHVRMKAQGPIENQTSWVVGPTPRDSVNRYHIHPRTRNLTWDQVCGYEMHRFGGSSSSMSVSLGDSLYLARTSLHNAVLHNTAIYQHRLILAGHTSDVQCVSFSLDGSRLVSSGEESTVRVWNTQVDAAEESGAERRALLSLHGHKSWVRAVAFSPDGTRIVSASDDKTVRVWDARGGECTGIFPAHADVCVVSTAFTPEGDAILTSTVDNTLRICDAATGDCLAAFKRDTWHRTLRLASDGSSILVGTGETERLIRMWSTPDTPPDVTASLPWLPRRSWPAYNIDSDRWLWSVAPGRNARRICHIPQDWGLLIASRGAALVFSGGQILDVLTLALSLGI